MHVCPKYAPINMSWKNHANCLDNWKSRMTEMKGDRSQHYFYNEVSRNMVLKTSCLIWNIQYSASASMRQPILKCNCT